MAGGEFRVSRRGWIRGALGVVGLALFGCGAEAGDESTRKGTSRITPLGVPPESWRGKVSPEAYAVLFENETERPRSSPLDREKRAGTYLCAACHLPLFDSTAKFDSGTGWPSFFRALEGHITTKADYSMILPRTSYECARCDGHQGHVFDDGPPPTGLRYCNNGVALRFVPEGEPLPALRS